ncbi:MAG: o-succinylbenzoate synthase [Propionibacteriaceae bacterium]|jgi:O-succinylbenzoate synthase|nr:o-succinylbenzoate synthase [Propionibacteriaceae bacterium]
MNIESLPAHAPEDAFVYDIPMHHRFRGITHRHGMIWRGPAGWAEWSPFLDYGPEEIAPWLRAAQEMAEVGFPEPVRTEIPVNVTIPAVSPEVAFHLTATSGCSTAKVKVAEPGQSLAHDMVRLEAVRQALPQGAIRVDANGGWSVDDAETALRHLNRVGLEYAEQPCRTVEELAELRRRLRPHGIRIAADESIRRADDPLRVAELEAADIVVLKVQPLGGVRACLAWADRLGLPVVVSSALETSIGLAAGVALAASLPTLPYACGLNTSALFKRDVTDHPLAAVDGVITVRPIEPDPSLLETIEATADDQAFWRDRWEQTAQEEFKLQNLP